MATLAKIRWMHLRDGLSIREVSRRTGLSRNTVRQWLRHEGVTEPKYPRREAASAVDVWSEHLASALKADGHRPVRERRTLFVGGLRRRREVAHTKLASSRAFWLTAYPGQSRETLFDAHVRAFEALGGVLRRGIYDNMKTAVDRVGVGKLRSVNARSRPSGQFR